MTTEVVGTIVLVLVIVGLVVSIIGGASETGYKIQIPIQSSALVLTICRLIMQVNAGESVGLTVLLAIIILVNLIQDVVYLVQE